MSDPWETKSLFEAIELQRGFDLPASSRQPGSIPVIASTSVVGNHNTPKVRGPGVVVGRSGSIGGAQWIDKDFWPLNTTLWVKNFRGNDPLFVYYLLKSIDFSAFNVGSGVPTLNRNHLSAVPVVLPPLEEQRRIAGVLGALDDLIEVNRGLVLDLQELALANYRQAVERWSVSRTVGEVARFENNKRVPLSAAQRLATPGDYPYFGAAGQMDSVGEYLFDGTRVLVGEDGTVVTSTGSPVVQFVTGRYWVNNHAHVLSGASISTELLRIALMASDVSAVITGAVQPKLSMGNLKSVTLRIPEDPAIDDAIQVLAQAELDMRTEISQLEATRDELLPLLMSGRVRVGEGVAA